MNDAERGQTRKEKVTHKARSVDEEEVKVCTINTEPVHVATFFKIALDNQLCLSFDLCTQKQLTKL